MSARAVQCTPWQPHARAVAASPLSRTFAPYGCASASIASTNARWRSGVHAFSRTCTRARPASKARRASAEETRFADLRRHRDAVALRQRESREDRRIGGEQGPDGEASGRLPFERLAVVADRRAFELQHALEVELDVRVLVLVAAHEPWRGAADDDAELLVQFAIERIARRLAGLELAAGKLPVAGVHLARRTLREQHAAIAQDHRGSDLDDGAFAWHRRLGPFAMLAGDSARRASSSRPLRVSPHVLCLRFSPAAPAWLFANCHATRPLREPRCNANCSASRVRASASRADDGAPIPNASSHPATAAR